MPRQLHLLPSGRRRILRLIEMILGINVDPSFLLLLKTGELKTQSAGIMDLRCHINWLTWEIFIRNLQPGSRRSGQQQSAQPQIKAPDPA